MMKASGFISNEIRKITKNYSSSQVSHEPKYQRATSREWSAKRNSSGAIPLFPAIRFEIHE